MISLRKYYIGKVGKSDMTDAGNNITTMLSMLCDIPIGKFLFKNTPVSYNKSINSKLSRKYNMLIGTCVLKRCILITDLEEMYVGLASRHVTKQNGIYVVEALQDPKVKYYDMSINDLYRMQKSVGSSVDNLSIDEFVETAGVDAIIRYAESLETNKKGYQNYGI